MDEDQEKIPVNRSFLEDKRFSEEDRNGQYSDEEFIELILNRVRCLECDHYFQWRPGFWGSTGGRCRNCDVKYAIHEEEHGWQTIEHGPVVVVVIDSNDKTGKSSVRIVGGDGGGWAFAEYMDWIGKDWSEYEDEYCGP